MLDTWELSMCCSRRGISKKKQLMSHQIFISSEPRTTCIEKSRAYSEITLATLFCRCLSLPRSGDFRGRRFPTGEASFRLAVFIFFDHLHQCSSLPTLSAQFHQGHVLGPNENLPQCHLAACHELQRLMAERALCVSFSRLRDVESVLFRSSWMTGSSVRRTCFFQNSVHFQPTYFQGQGRNGTQMTSSH